MASSYILWRLHRRLAETQIVYIIIAEFSIQCGRSYSARPSASSAVPRAVIT